MRARIVVLAAGLSRRAWPDHKLLLDLDGLPVIARTVDAALAAGLGPPLVVLGHAADAVAAALAGRTCDLVRAADYADGMGRSLATGIAALDPGTEAALIALGDMPWVRATTCGALLAAAGQEVDAVVPVLDGVRGHPVLFKAALFPALARLKGDQGARGVLAAARVRTVEVGDPGILADIDQKADLNRTGWRPTAPR